MIKTEPLKPLNDPLNLKAFIGILSKPANSGSAVSVIRLLIRGIESVDHSGEYKAPTVEDIQKLLSGNLSEGKTKNLSALVKAGIYDRLFRENLQHLVDDLKDIKALEPLIELLQERTIPRFFTDDELEALRSLLDEKAYAAYLTELLRHGFATTDNIPVFFSWQAFEQTLTLSPGSPVWAEVTKDAADNGSELACLEYANHLMERDDYDLPLTEQETLRYEEALDYCVRADSFDPALWNIGFMLQRYQFPPKTLSRVKKGLRINTKMSRFRVESMQDEQSAVYPAPDLPNPDGILLAYRIHFYLAYERHFAKAFNSLGNYLYFNQMLVDEAKAGMTREDLILKYWTMAADRHDIYAISNLGSQWVRELLDPESNPLRIPFGFDKSMCLLQTAADKKMPQAMYNLARLNCRLLIGPLPDYADQASMRSYQAGLNAEDVRRQLLHALESNRHHHAHQAELYYCLGTLEKAETERFEYFEKAAGFGHPEAMYELLRQQYIRDRESITVLQSIRDRLKPIIASSGRHSEDAARLLQEVEQKLKQLDGI